MSNKGQAGLVILVVFGIIILSMGLGWLVQGNDFFMFKFWAPKYENVNRQIFENTMSYTQGMAQDLSNAKMQYVQATPDQKAGLASIIVHRFADYDVSKLPPDLQDFLQSLRDKGVY